MIFNTVFNHLIEINLVDYIFSDFNLTEINGLTNIFTDKIFHRQKFYRHDYWSTYIFLSERSMVVKNLIYLVSFNIIFLIVVKIYHTQQFTLRYIFLMLTTFSIGKNLNRIINKY